MMNSERGCEGSIFRMFEAPWSFSVVVLIVCCSLQMFFPTLAGFCTPFVLCCSSLLGLFVLFYSDDLFVNVLVVL